LQRLNPVGGISEPPGVRRASFHAGWEEFFAPGNPAVARGAFAGGPGDRIGESDAIRQVRVEWAQPMHSRASTMKGQAWPFGVYPFFTGSPVAANSSQAMGTAPVGSRKRAYLG